MSDRALPVSLYGQHIGDLDDVEGEGRRRAVLRWAPDGPWRLNSAALSRHLRVGVESPDATESFFGNLLPEGVHLDELARATQTSTTDLVGMFAVVGADLAGALRIGAPGRAQEPQTLTSPEVRALLRRAPGFLVGGGGSALPGFQRKLTLSRIDGTWVRGNGTIASTHILKPVSADARPAAEAEAYALAVARELGLVTFDSWVEQVDDLTVLVIERYDRHPTASGEIERVHQEDLAQALGLPPFGNHKFQRAEPRANLAAIAAELDTDATVFRPGTDGERLLRYVTLNVAVGNTDAHAKNFSLIHDPTGTTRLAPLYDIAPLALAFDATPANAMTINGVWDLPSTTADDLVAEATTWGIEDARARQLVDDTLHGIVEATRTLPAHRSIDAHVPGFIRGQAQNLLAGKPARIDSHVPLIMLPGLGTHQEDQTP